MATSANLPPGATPTNGASDPFTGPGTGALRYASFDTEHFSLYSSNSPSHAKRALEAHLKDTDRRIQDASRLGTTLLQQRKELSARLKDVEQVDSSNEVPAELRKKLKDLEQEYNEIGRESARAFLPKTRAAGDVGITPPVISNQARESPTKLTASSRRQRNQPSNRVHDIEFAAEISTSLLAQVRQLQSALAEKDDALNDAGSAKARLEADVAGMAQRMKHLDENEQRYKDENWNLEMKLQDLESAHRDVSDKHDRSQQALKSAESEKTAAQRELDELRVTHERLNDDHSVVKRQQETDLHTLRRDVSSHQTERQSMQKKIEELNVQNTELARAVAYRWNQPTRAISSEFLSAEEDTREESYTPDHSEPNSPMKGTPRHGMLESETLRSSLNHAHRMIQNLKNNIHREKTEKLELKRMLQDSRDELETRRREGSFGNLNANVIKKRRAESEAVKFKRPTRPERLGPNRSSTTEILEDEPDWEDHEEERTPSKSRFDTVTGAVARNVSGGHAFDHAAFGGEQDSTDAFETANERDLTTETEAFETGQEDMTGDEGDLTETEDGLRRIETIRARGVSPLASRSPGDRTSFQSTASASGDEADNIRTPVHNQQPKYKLRVSRGNRRSGRVSDVMSAGPNEPSPGVGSPTSSNGTPQVVGQSLGDELDALDDDSADDGVSEDFAGSPETLRHASVEPGTPSKMSSRVRGNDQRASSANTALGGTDTMDDDASPRSAINRSNYVDASIMTEPWGPQKEGSGEHSTLLERAEGMFGGALAGFGLGRLTSKNDHEEAQNSTNPGAERGPVDSAETSENVSPPVQADVKEPKSLSEDVARPLSSVQPESREEPAVSLQRSDILTVETEPMAPAPMPGAMRTVSGVGLVQPHVVPSDAADASQALPELGFSPVDSQAAEVASSLGPAQRAVVPSAAADEVQALPALGFSAVLSQTYEPEASPEPALPPTESSLIPDQNTLPGIVGRPDSQALPGTDRARPGAGFLAFGLPSALRRDRSKSMPSGLNADVEADRALIEPKVFGGVRRGEGRIPTLVFGGDSDSETEAGHQASRQLTDTSSNVDLNDTNINNVDPIPTTKPLQIRKPMTDEGSQTMVSGSDIDAMVRDKRTGTSMADAGVSPFKPTASGRQGQRSSHELVPSVDLAALARGPRRPASAGSMRTRGGVAIPPPLPEDFTQRITAAQKGPSTAGTAPGTMGPPVVPASAYRSNRPKTPADRVNERSMSRDGTTPRPVRQRDSRTQLQGATGVSRRGSVSSFASELDERFNITRGDLTYPSDVTPATDPRMIQAITQTMIGEYLWKYTRKAGRSETSTTRHRRFFWVHPYTRTLYWSEQDPSTAGRNMLKAKSVAIQTVRVVTDDNTYPPGLHRKSIVVVTPGREIVFTAPTGQRHETWFNALSYLLLRTEHERNEAEDTFDQADLDEFKPGSANGGGFSLRRSIGRMTGGRDRTPSQSRMSLSSYNSRTTRTSSPQRREVAGTGSVAHRQSVADPKINRSTTPNLHPAARSMSRTSTTEPNHGTVTGRFSSFTSRLRPGSSQRGSFSTTGRGRSSMSSRSTQVPGITDPSDIYDASVVNDSAEDLRAVIERQERDADRLENVRACCDGKHDVGSLSRNGGKHHSIGGRFGSTGHSHSHGHAHPRAEPMKDSTRPRRGE